MQIGDIPFLSATDFHDHEHDYSPIIANYKPIVNNFAYFVNYKLVVDKPQTSGLLLSQASKQHRSYPMANLSQLQKSLDNTILDYQRGRTVTTKRLHLLSEVRLRVTLDSNIPAQYQDLLTDRMQQIAAYAFSQQQH